jgi:hypothetical protein
LEGSIVDLNASSAIVKKQTQERASFCFNTGLIKTNSIHQGKPPKEAIHLSRHQSEAKTQIYSNKPLKTICTCYLEYRMTS